MWRSRKGGRTLDATIALTLKEFKKRKKLDMMAVGGEPQQLLSGFQIPKMVISRSQSKPLHHHEIKAARHVWNINPPFA